MSARFVALLITAVSLAACGTTGTTTTTTEAEERKVTPPPTADRLVVRSPLVPDEGDEVTPVAAPVSAPAKKTVKPPSRVAMADSASVPEVETPPVAKPVVEKPAPPQPKPSDTAVVTPPGSTGSSGSSGPGSGSSTGPTTPAPSGDTTSGTTSSDVTPVPLSEPIEPPATVSAEPETTAAAPKPSPFAVDFKDMINAKVAGFPLWMMVGVGILLAAGLVFGVGGARRRKPRVEPAREEHTYAERVDDDAVPA